MPVLHDGRLLDPPYGRFILSAGAVGEGQVIVLSLILAHNYIGWQALMMLAFVAGTCATVALARSAQDGYLANLFTRTMPTSGQLPFRP